jgi:hypothetical protein
MVTNVTKIRETKDWHTFSYRDQYNEEQLIEVPAFWKMTEEEVELYIEL